ncbi:MAG: cell division protein FtsZ [Bacteroidota bacterium]
MIQFEVTKDQSSIIKVIGVGGGGSNAVNHMYRQGIKGVEFLVCNTDSQALDISPVPRKIQLGPSLTEGRGAGSLPEVGKQAAIENIDDLRSTLENTKMVFITAGMGGGTGTGAAPIIAGVAKEMGILTVGIVTIPFSFEGRKRKVHADNGIEEMKKNVDALLIISNDKLREIYGNLNLSQAFGHADDVLAVAAKSIAEIITVTMQVNVDFADIQTVMRDSGVAIMGSALAEGENRALIAAEQAIDSPLLNDNHIEGARYILLNIASGSKEATMDEVGEINDYVQEQAGQTADIIMGIGTDASLGEKISVTIIATGFKTNNQIATDLKKPERVVHVLTPETPVASSNEEIKTAPVAEVKNEMVTVEVHNPLEPVLIVKEEVIVEKEFIVAEEQKEVFNIAEEQKIVHQLDEQKSVELDLPLELDPPATSPGYTTQGNVIVEEPVHAQQPAPAPQKEEQLSQEEEMFRRSRERIMKLKELSYRMNTPNGIADLEKEPAYKRRNVVLNNVPSSAESNVSRYTLSTDENNEKRTELRSNNPFLHDRVD